LCHVVYDYMYVLDYTRLSSTDLLDRQHGVLTREQAVGAGLSRHAIASRVDTGRWQRLYPGVFVTFSGPIPRATLLWGAVLRAGDQAVLSHHTAAELWKLSDAPSSSIHVSVPRQAGPLAAPGLVVHYSVRLAAARHPARLPPQTTLEETVLDLAALAAMAEDAVAWPIRACQRRLTTPDKMVSALNERNRVRWRRDIAEAITENRTGAQSPLELRYLRNVERKHGLPRGDRQMLAIRGSRRLYLDVRYSDYGVIVELDGVSAHPVQTRQHDAWRDNANTLAGNQTLRYGWVPVAYHACEVTIEVATLLRQRGWRGTLRPCGKDCQVATLKVRPVIGGQTFSTSRAHLLVPK
jgi:predicted transcriptional regulator of viral defense system